MAKHAQRPIVRKIIVEEAHGHHGGAWKVAYADFVTAMMAFFLLLWLISSADEETLVGLSQYFSDAKLNNGTPGGVGGILDGISFTPEVMIRAPESPFNMQPTLPFRRDDQPETDLLDPNFAEGAEGGVELAERLSPDGDVRPAHPMSPGDRRGAVDHASTADHVSEEALEAELERRAQEQVEAIAERLAEALEGQTELRRFKDHLFVEDTAEGVRIQLVDQEQASMFPVGSDAMYPHTERLLEAVVAAVGGLPNRLSIRGHTDALPYAQGAAYDNWRLSSARADATRRTMMALGLAPRRVADVVGKGDGEPLLVEAPEDPRNRRISIVLLDEPASR